MSHHQHKQAAPSQVRVFVLTISDTRTEDNDTGGQLARQLLTEAGHEIVGHRIVRDEPAVVAEVLTGLAAEGRAEVAITTGGTGISRRDSTYEAVAALLERRLDGFGELFRMLSYQAIGSPAMLSRAVAGLHRGLAIFALPGSPAAVELALRQLILPELPHVVFEQRR